MKAVVLAAGKGTRMLPLTETVPKVLVKVAGKPFLYYVLKNLLEAGFDEVCLVIGYKKEKIAEFLEEYRFKATLVEQKEILGTGDAVKQAREFVGEDDFLVYYGDALIDANDLKRFNTSDVYHYIGGIEVDDPEGYGILITKNDLLIEVREKPKEFVGNLINTGPFKFTPEFWTALDQVKISERGEYEITDAVTMLAKQGKVKVIRLQDYWLDLGCKEDIPKIKAFLKNAAL